MHAKRQLGAVKKISHEDYWVKKLSSDLEKSVIPFDKPAGLKERILDTLEYRFSADILTRLSPISEGSELNIYKILVAALAVILDRMKYNAETDIIFGSPVLRHQGEDNPVNKVVAICNQIKTGMSFAQLYEEVSQNVDEADKHRHFPMAELLSKLKMKATDIDFPLFDVALSIENLHDKSYLEGIPVNVLFTFSINGESLGVKVDYNASAYEIDSILRIMEHFANLLFDVSANWDVKISDIQLLSEWEYKKLVEEFNDTASEYPKESNVNALFEDIVEKYPDNVAVAGKSFAASANDEPMTYRRFNEVSNRLGHVLRSKGIKPGMVAALMIEHCQEMMIGIMGILKAGGAYLPIKDGTPSDRIKYILEESGARFLITREALMEGVVFDGEIIYLDEPELYQSGEKNNPEILNNYYDLAYVIYTSGSTGKPKGVMIEHTALINLCYWYNDYYNVTQEDRATKYAGFGFDASVWEIFPFFLSGAALYVIPEEIKLDNEELRAYFELNKISISFLPTQVCEQFMNIDDSKSSLRVLQAGGDKLKTFVKRKFEVYNNYGPTENTVCTTSYLVEKLVPNIPIGKPLYNNQVYILDKNDKIQPIGYPGELCIGGDSLARGYVNKPEMNSEKFPESLPTLPEAGRIYRTGDLTRWLPDGNIEFLGRIDFQVKIRGNRIELGEIENQLLNIEEIKEAVVLALDDKESAGEKYLCGYIVSDDKVDFSAVTSILSRELPEYMIPAFFIQIESIPLTPNGKVDQRALAKIDAGYGKMPYLHKKSLEEDAQLEKKLKNEQTQFEEMALAGQTDILSHLDEPGRGKSSCFIIGNSMLPIQCGEILLKRGNKIYGIITNDSQVKEWAREKGIPYVRLRKNNVIPFLKLKPFDYLFSISNPMIITQEMLELPRKHAINYHNSPLPRYAGTNATNWAVLNGEKTHGLSWHLIDVGVDTGDIIKQVMVNIEEDIETGISLNFKCSKACVEAFEDVVTFLNNDDIPLQKQNHEDHTYFGKYKRPDSGGVISFNRTAQELSSLVRGLNFGQYENGIGLPRLALGNSFYILPELTVANSSSHLPPGTVTTIKSGFMMVSTASKDIKIRKLLSINGDPITISEMVEKHDLAEGYCFEEDAETAARIEELDFVICKHESFWAKRLSQLNPLMLTNTITGDGPNEACTVCAKTFYIPGEINGFDDTYNKSELIVSAFSAYLSLISGLSSFRIGYSDPLLRDSVEGITGIFAQEVPLNVKLNPRSSFIDFYKLNHKELKKVKTSRTYIRDIRVRYPSLKNCPEQEPPVSVALVERMELAGAISCRQLKLVVPKQGRACRFIYNSNQVDEGVVIQVLLHFLDFLHGIFSNPSSLMSEFVQEELPVKGRIEHLVKLRGKTIEPEVVEKSLMKHDLITDAAVVETVSKGAKYSLCAFLVSNEPISETSMIDYLSGKIEAYMIPGHFVQLDEMPLTKKEEPDRKLLKSVELKIGTGYEAPRDETDDKLADIFHEVLGVEKSKISITESFFRLGGHSLKAAILLTKIHKELGVKISMSRIFEFPSIKQIAEFIKDSAHEVEDTYSAIKKAEPKEYYPQTSTQKRMYFMSQMDQNSILYNIPIMNIYQMGTKKENLEEAFKKLIQRHESLRTSFHTVAGEAVQKVHEHEEVGYNFKIDYYETAEDGMIYSEQPGKEWTRITGLPFQEVVEHFVQPFDLGKAPLLRVGFIDIAGVMQILMMDIHHIVADGVSVVLLLDEIWKLYEGKELPGLTVHYKDFAEWANSDEQLMKVKEQEAFWLEQFSGEIPVLNLPTDYTRPAEMTFDGDSTIFEIDKTDTQKMKLLAQKEGSTLFMGLFTAFNVLLAKLSGQEDLVTGIVTAGRSHVDVHNIVGMFVDTLAMRNYPESEKTLKEFMEEVKISTLAAFENQNYPFEELVRKVAPRQDAGRNPLFDVLFEIENEDDRTEFLLEALMMDKSNPYSYNVNKAKFDISVIGVETNDGMRFNFEYKTRIFKEETIERFILYYKKIISSMCQDIQVKISDIDIISDKEKDQILYEFNDTSVEYPRDKTLHQLFESRVEETPGNIALKYNDDTMTYLEFNEKANQLAWQLRERGVQPDKLVGIMVERSFEMIVGIFAIIKAGGAYLPIDPNYPEDRIKYLFEDSDSRLLLTQEKHIEFARSVDFTGEVLNLNDDMLYRGNRQNPDPVNSPENLAYIIYTSGSTGKPKGVAIEHVSAVNLMLSLNQIYPLEESDAYLLKTAFLFDVSVSEIFGWYWRGGRLVILEQGGEKDPLMMIDKIHEEKITHLNFVPSMFNIFVSMLDEQNIDKLSGLKYIFLAGEAIWPESIGKFRALNSTVVIDNLYGPTEATVYASLYPVAKWSGYGSVPIGRPVENLKLYILGGDEHAQPCLQPVGVAGELLISGIGLARGYLNRPELSAEKFMDNPYFLEANSDPSFKKLYSTGDLCRWFPDGNVEYMGRIDFQVKVRGFRIELGEIESQLMELEPVKEAIVIARENEERQGDKYLCAYLLSDEKLDMAFLRKSLLLELPEYMVPSYFIQIDEIPLNPSGKLDRKALPQPEIKTLTEDYIAPTNETETLLAKEWADVLGMEKVSIDDNFFEIGGDSIKTIMISAKMLKLGLKVNVNDFFANRTIRQLAKKVKKVERTVDQGPVSGFVELMPIHYWLFNRNFSDKHHFNHVVMNFSEEGYGEGIIREVFSKIVEHHDALRMIYQIDGERVVQKNRSLRDGEPFDMEVMDFRDSVDADFDLEEEVNRINRGIDLANGPLVKLALFRTKTGDYFMIGIHHAVIDGISWRIIIEDLEAGYRSAKQSQDIKFPEKSDSYKDWSYRLKEYADSARALKEIEYWKNLEETHFEKLPKDHEVEEERQTFGNRKELLMTLDPGKTGTLLKEVNWVYNTEINDILLTALGLAVNEWTGIDQVLVELEGHGREGIIEDIDFSRTVGWFTSQYPVLLDMSRSSGNRGSGDEVLAAQLKDVKESIRRIPNKGVGFGILKYLTAKENKEGLNFKLHPEISFNYLGQLSGDPDLSDNRFKLKIANSMSPDFDSGYNIDIYGGVGKDGLELTFSYNRFEYEPDRMQKFVKAYKSNLIKIIDLCVKKKEEITAKGMTTMDYHVKKDYDRYLERIANETWEDLGKKKVYKNILLTGGTGFMGAHMVYEFLKTSDSTLYLPVRGSNQEAAEERFKNRMTFYFGDGFFDRHKKRLNVLRSDLSEEMLGIDEEQYEKLCMKVDAVVHPAANVKHHGSYEELEKDNVLGTQQLLELAMQGKEKDFHYISTLDTGRGDIPGQEYNVFTEFSLDDGQRTEQIYIRSKFEAEQRVLAYRENLNASIYRVGNLIFHTDTGKFQENIEDDYFYAIMRGAIKLNMITDNMKKIVFDMSFINSIAEATVLLITRENEKLKNEIFHLCNPNQLPMVEMREILAKLGYHLNDVNQEDFDSYLAKFEGKGNEEYEKIIELLKLHSWLFEEKVQTQAFYKIDRTVMLLKRLNFEWPKANEKLIEKMIDYCKEVGFLW